MARRQALLLCALASAFLLLLGVSLRATGSWRVAFLMGAVGAAEETVGPGFFDKMTDALIPAAATPAAGRGEVLGGAPPPASSLPPKDPATMVPCGSQDCGDVGALPPAAPEGDGDDLAGATSADAEEEARLRLIKMKERERGESRTYGMGSAGSSSARSRGEPKTEASLEASFEGMINKLKGRASAQAGSSGGAASLGDSSGRSGQGGGGADGDDLPVITRNGQVDSRYDSPTLRALQKVNSNSAHSYGMTNDPGLEDGSKDHAGKSFDGNQNTFGDIPISEKKGAMGRKQIIVAPVEP